MASVSELWTEEGAACSKGTLIAGPCRDKQWPRVGKEECSSLVFHFPQKWSAFILPLTTERLESWGDSQLPSSTAPGPHTSGLCSKCPLPTVPSPAVSFAIT